MICEQCDVELFGCFEREQTIIGFDRFTDDDGNIHVHDSNVYTDYWTCKCGHKWTNKFHIPCYHCGWILPIDD